MNNQKLIDVALASAVSKLAESAKKSLEPGRYSIDEIIQYRIKGTVLKAEDTEYVPTSKIPLTIALALFIEKSGIMRERAKAILVDSMQEALEMSDKPSEVIAERINDINEAMNHVSDMTSQFPKQVRAGKCQWTGIIEKVSDMQNALDKAIV